MKAIVIEGLTKCYGNITAVNGLSLSVEEGSFSLFSESMEQEKPLP